MKILRGTFFTAWFLFLIFFIDGQLSRSLVDLFAEKWHPASHILLFFTVFLFLNFSKEYIFFLFFTLGLFYDIYYLHVIGLFTFILPLLTVVIYHFLSVFLLNRWTRVLAIITIVFFFEMISFASASFLHLASFTFPDFIIYALVPTLVFNAFLFLLLQPLFEKVYL